MPQALNLHCESASVDPCSQVEGRIAAVTSTLRLARSVLETGRVVDVEGLDRTIGILCARALDLPPDQGRQVRPNLALLLIELDALSVAMNTP